MFHVKKNLRYLKLMNLQLFPIKYEGNSEIFYTGADYLQ